LSSTSLVRGANHDRHPTAVPVSGSSVSNGPGASMPHAFGPGGTCGQNRPVSRTTTMTGRLSTRICNCRLFVTSINSSLTIRNPSATIQAKPSRRRVRNAYRPVRICSGQPRRRVSICMAGTVDRLGNRGYGPGQMTLSMVAAVGEYVPGRCRECCC
jgi:hypothetical protein